jgi:hypothetical protein
MSPLLPRLKKVQLSIARAKGPARVYTFTQESMGLNLFLDLEEALDSLEKKIADRCQEGAKAQVLYESLLVNEPVLAKVERLGANGPVLEGRS